MSSFSGKRILVLEDEFLLALEVADTLKDLGVVVVGPAHRIDAALSLVSSERLDGALLDVNIGGVSSDIVAQRLAAIGVPVVFATGYGQQADVLPGALVVDKPYSREDIATALSRIL